MMDNTQTIARCFSFVLFGMLTAEAAGRSLKEARGSLAGASKQDQERWQAVQEGLKNDGGLGGAQKR